MIRKIINFRDNYFKRKIEEGVDKRFSKFGYIPISQTQPQDIFIVGFPKSGNTWMQHMMTGIHYKMDMEMIHNNLVRDLTPDEHVAKLYRRYGERMFFKSHALPAQRYKKVIYIVRDGRDAVVSFYNMQKGRGRDITMAAIVENNQGLVSSWHDHVQAWLKNPHKADIHFVKYEDLKARPYETMTSVCGFCGLSIPDHLLNAIISNCSFSSMRKKEESEYWEKAKDWEKGKYFVRKGEVGGFKNEFDPVLLKKFEQSSYASLKHFGYI